LRREEITLGIYLRPEIPEGSLRREHEIGLIYAKRLVHATRAHVGNHGGQARGELVLDIEVPLRDVVALLARFKESAT
jgi:hypothetical protein